ncbi:hypothetical protein ACRTEA_24620, partial [Vibrio alginolyticus]|uniref:hypothetical protein n=1 Tax=Vibrio alginolyticus TaxID=663 RepID=UPI003D7DF635
PPSLSVLEKESLKMVFIRKSSSLTIWKADKTIFKIVCKVLNVYRKINTKKHIQVFLGISLLQ